MSQQIAPMVRMELSEKRAELIQSGRVLIFMCSVERWVAPQDNQPLCDASRREVERF